MITASSWQISQNCSSLFFLQSCINFVFTKTMWTKVLDSCSLPKFSGAQLHLVWAFSSPLIHPGSQFYLWICERPVFLCHSHLLYVPRKRTKECPSPVTLRFWLESSSKPWFRCSCEDLPPASMMCANLVLTPERYEGCNVFSRVMWHFSPLVGICDISLLSKSSLICVYAWRSRIIFISIVEYKLESCCVEVKGSLLIEDQMTPVPRFRVAGNHFWVFWVLHFHYLIGLKNQSCVCKLLQKGMSGLRCVWYVLLKSTDWESFERETLSGWDAFLNLTRSLW